jgi:class 3 adenylate cyclase
MMDNYTFYLILIAGIIIGLSLFLIRQYLINRQLENLLDNTNLKLERLQTHFGSFAPQEVIEHLTEPDSEYTTKRKSVTVLFADLKGFTKMCEQMDPTEVVSILNGYFQCMSNALSNHHGRVTELTGDGLLALFGALRPNPWQVQDAVMSGLAMREALVKYNDELKLKSLPQLSFGIGIHQGEVLAGIMGNIELSKFGVVGDTINVASRVESLTRVHNVDLLVSSEVENKLNERFSVRRMPPVKVKGKQDPLVTYFVERLKTEEKISK